MVAIGITMTVVVSISRVSLRLSLGEDGWSKEENYQKLLHDDLDV